MCVFRVETDSSDDSKRESLKTVFTGAVHGKEQYIDHSSHPLPLLETLVSYEWQAHSVSSSMLAHLDRILVLQGQ